MIFKKEPCSDVLAIYGALSIPTANTTFSTKSYCNAGLCSQVTGIYHKRFCTKSFWSSFNMNAKIALCVKVVWRKMSKGLPNMYEWGSFYAEFPSKWEGPFHIIQHWISSTVPAIIIPMSCVHLHMYILQATFLQCNVGYAPWWYNT